MTTTAIVAAMPAELKPLVRGWHYEVKKHVHLWSRTVGANQWIAACAGAGQPAGVRAFAAIESRGPIARAVSVGWAGALASTYIPGQSYRLSGVIDALTGERFTTADSPGEHWAVTSPIVAGKAEKRRLRDTYDVGLVDMEGAAVARLAAQRDIPFFAVKAVSDALDDEIPDFNMFMSPDGQFGVVRLAIFALLRPRYWPALIRMGENSKKASASIASRLIEFLEV